MIKPLASFWRKKTAKASTDTSEKQEVKNKPESDKDDEGDDEDLDDEGDDEDQDDDDEDQDQEVEESDDKKKKASLGKDSKGKKEAAMVSIKASEYEKLKADASAWTKNKKEFAVLRDWHKNAKESGTGSAKEDENTRKQRETTKTSVQEKPWNKKAIERYNNSK
ncbi:hypothetical protein [Siphonobacter sp. SORGH_AS_1065]|uniref:hypothetical protein n=1 Tax=Siphonobacter sp. SORGH_AS_1065 TaxID=3041795 RepID=UPI00278915D1|nr:hypothetical protein [Siphonobacter sp. SORGH_AS_1065]MDQ1089004.1 cobalamin biosynthesis protein CobT [Siphonobacter sp. SORGH_AS_1065]